MASINNRIRILGGELVINIEGRNIAAWTQRLEAARGRMTNMKPAFEKYGQYLLRVVERNFQAEGRPKWQALSPAYAKWKAKRFGNRGILVATGGLQNSFRVNASNAELVIGNTRTIKGKSLFDIHQDGLGHNPKRPMLILNDRDRGELTRITRRYIEEGIV